MLLTFTIDSSVDIQDSYFDERFRLWRALCASIRASGFHAYFGPRVPDEQFGLQFKFGGNFGLWASRSSTALVVAVGHLRVLWASLRASAGAIRIGWLGLRRHSGRALLPALAAGERPNRARTGILPQQPCPDSIPLYTVAAVMLNLYATGAAAGHWTGPLKQHAGLKQGCHFWSIRPLLPIFTSFLNHYYLLWQ